MNNDDLIGLEGLAEMMLGIAAEQMALRDLLKAKGITDVAEFQSFVDLATRQLRADPGIQRMLDRVRMLDIAKNL
jgi:hypothetical protein